MRDRPQPDTGCGLSATYVIRDSACNDLSSPFVDAVLPDGSRLHVVIPDITRQHWAVNIAHQ